MDGGAFAAVHFAQHLQHRHLADIEQATFTVRQPLQYFERPIR